MRSGAQFPHGLFLTDRTVRRSRLEVNFITPPQCIGMGTYESRLGSGSEPVVGTAHPGAGSRHGQRDAPERPSPSQLLTNYYVNWMDVLAF